MKRTIFVFVLITMIAALTLFAKAQEDDAAFELAEQGVSSNDEWQPVIQEFDGVEMVLVPAGSFMMGSADDEQLEAAVEQCVDAGSDRNFCLTMADTEQPAHEQQFDKPFWIDRFEVTIEQYGLAIPELDDWDNKCSTYSSEPEHPLNCVTWYEAKEHCESRSARLPSEREWEYAARGPDSLLWTWGNEYIAENAVYSRQNPQPKEVGSIPEGASWVGALDLSGNMMEWVNTISAITPNENQEWGDWSTEFTFSYPYDAEDGREDPDRFDTLRVLRGGDFGITNPYFLRAAWRGHNPGQVVATVYGFRCARDYDY